MENPEQDGIEDQESEVLDSVEENEELDEERQGLPAPGSLDNVLGVEDEDDELDEDEYNALLDEEDDED